MSRFRNKSVERNSLRTNLNRTIDDSLNNKYFYSSNKYTILREKKRSIGNNNGFMNLQNWSPESIENSYSDSMLRLPQMKLSNTRNNIPRKGQNSESAVSNNLTADQYIKLRNNGYFARETFGSASNFNN